MNKPFFSIILPTLNRASKLRCAINALLSQKFHNFELIIADNNSTDRTKEVVQRFDDQRIHYFKNYKNIGWVPSMRKAIRRTVGKYVLFHGDDDFMIDENFLNRLYVTLQKNRFGFVRINYLSYSDEQKIIFDFHNKQFTKQILPVGLKGERIIEFIDYVDPFFMTGIVVKGEILREKSLMQSEFVPWFKPIYRATKKYGAMLWPEYEFVATWSNNAAYPRYYLTKGKFRFERYFEEVKKHVSKDYYQKFLHKRLNILIEEFPAGKFFTSNSNFFRYALHLLDLDSTFRFSLKYWFWIAFSLLTPKVILKFLRKRLVEFRQDKSLPNLDAVYKKIAFLEKLSDDKA